MEYLNSIGIVITIILSVCMIAMVVCMVVTEIRSPEEPKERVYCKDCKYCQQCPDGSGLCRVTAPMPPQEEPGFTAWPRVGADDWCGEGVSKEKVGDK